MSNLQTILVSVFIASFVFAVLIFSGLINIGGSSGGTAVTGPTGRIVIWGTFSSSSLAHAFDGLADTNRSLTISYIQKDPATYEQSLIESFARGTGPDLFLISPDMIIKFEPFIYKLPFASYPQKTFTDSFIDGASVYLSPDGTIGLPVAVDPLVMYYNKDILSNEGIAQPPVYWDELSDVNSRLTKARNDGTITRSMIALGRFDNITNAKDILATMLMQNGDNIVNRTSSGYTPVLNTGNILTGPDNQITLYTQFSDPSNGMYSWNSALPKSLDYFTGGKMALYLGRASELFKIQSTNPNLNFDVSEMLETRNTTAKRTYGEIYALAVNKNSKNLASAFGAAGLISSGDNAKSLASSLSLPPVLKSLLSTHPENPYMLTFFNSAIFTRTWLDPDSNSTDAIFSELIDNVISNKLSIGGALSKAQNQLELLISSK
ncbi:MAG: extracellular solute-binding protein [bacterium]